MTLAASGEMSIGGSTSTRSINLELNRSATATSSLNETSLRSLAGVSSGAISISSFYGKTADYTPDAVNWADIFTFGPLVSTGTNPNQTITGINQQITIKVSWTVTGGTITSVEYRINSGSYVSMSNNGTFTINNNDTLNFRVGGAASTLNTADFTIKNNSTSDSTIDTFTAEIDRT